MRPAAYTRVFISSRRASAPYDIERIFQMNKLTKIWDNLVNGKEEEQETEFLPAILEVTETPPSPVGRMVMWSILAILVVMALWSYIGTINEVAVAPGKVIPMGQVKTVQVKNKGIINEILVKDGDIVKEGEVLVRLDPTSTGADYDSLKKRLAYFALDIDRLNAELSGTPFLPKSDPDLEARDIAAEQALYQSRTNQYRAERDAAVSAIAQREASLASEIENYKKFAEVLEIAQDKEHRLEMLVEQNAVAEFQLLEQKAQRIQYEKTADAQREILVRAEAELAEARQRLSNVDAAYNKDIMTSLVDARKQYYAIEEELKKAEEDKRLATIKAPCDGKVYNLSVHTVGGIVTDAQPLMMIVPDGATLEFEVWADNKDIGFIHRGQEAEVKVSTFNFQKFGMINAIVEEIGADAYDDSHDPAKDKKFRLLLKPLEVSMNVMGKDVMLTPGMDVTAEVKIREKRIIAYFMDPFRKYTHEALRER